MLFGLWTQTQFRLPKLYALLSSLLLLIPSMVFAQSSEVSELISPPAPANLMGTIEGTNVVLEWDAIENATGYNLYSNNAYLTTVLRNEYEGVVEDGGVYNFYVVAFVSSDQNDTAYSPRSEQITLPESAIPDDLTIPPSVPTGLSGSIDNTTVTLQWTASIDDEAVSGYNIYQNNQYLTTVFSTDYTGEVEAGKTYSYRVVAFDVRVNFSAASDQIRLPDTGPVDTTIPPSSPDKLDGNLIAINDIATVEIQWEASTDDQSVAGYNIYENNAYKTTVFDTEYSTTVAAGKPYSYYVVAFDYDANFSQRSRSLLLPKGAVVEDDTQAPSAPANLHGTWEVAGNNATVTLNWDASTDNATVAGYNIYENKNYLTTVQSTSFETFVDASELYAYNVVAFDVARNFSASSERLLLPAGDNQPPSFEGLTDVLAYAGGEVEIDIKPIDIDGDTPGLFIGTLPEGMYSEDNLDGTRTLRWSPLQPHVGVYNIAVTAFDSTDSSLQTNRNFQLTIEMPDDPSTIRNVPPGIDLIREHTVRYNDNVIMEVKATDLNGTVPELTLTNLPEMASFTQHEEYPNVKVLRWTVSEDDAGINELAFKAVDSVDSSLTAESVVRLNVADPSLFVRSGERLKDLAADHQIDIGYASLLKYYNRPDADLYSDVAAEEFNLVSTENSMKWGYMNPEPGVYRFDAADELMLFAAKNAIKVHGHTLVWYTSLPQWVQQSPVDEREDIMNTYIDVLTERYDGVEIWDVVNEAFEDDGSYRNSVWYQAMGEDHIEKAFRRARAGAPNATLIYNDYDIAYGEGKTDATFALMEKLIANDAPIDGIGFQMHVGSDFTAFNKIRDTFERFANLGLDIYITEMDVSMREGTTLDDQATVYETITTICLEQAACKAIQVWGITDRYSWLDEYSPLLLDEQYQAKPAYRAMQRALSSTP